MNLLVSICVLLYGILTIIGSQLSYITASPQTLVQSLIAIAGGLFFSVKYGYPYLVNIKLPVNKVSLKPSTNELKDIECLIYLRNRLSGHKEGLETVSKLNSIIFTLGMNHEKTDINSVT